jgi:hypothetical protein
MALDLLLQLVGGRRRGAAAEDLGPGVLDELEQTHAVLRLFRPARDMAKP